jgi:hypothetical protein
MENLKNIVTIAAKLGSVAGCVLEDKKVNVADFAYVAQLAMMFPLFAAVDFTKVSEEIKELKVEDMPALVEHFNAQFDLPTSMDSLESQIERVLSIVSRVSALILDLIAVFKK